MRRRRPLMRAAMVGGGAYVAGKHVAAGQAARGRPGGADRRARGAAGPAAGATGCPAPARRRAAAPPPRAAGGTDIASKLVELKGLMDQGVLTQDEFDQAKQKLLAG